MRLPLRQPYFMRLTSVVGVSLCFLCVLMEIDIYRFRVIYLSMELFILRTLCLKMEWVQTLKLSQQPSFHPD